MNWVSFFYTLLQLHFHVVLGRFGLEDNSLKGETTSEIHIIWKPLRKSKHKDSLKILQHLITLLQVEVKVQVHIQVELKRKINIRFKTSNFCH